MDIASLEAKRDKIIEQLQHPRSVTSGEDRVDYHDPASPRLALREIENQIAIEKRKSSSGGSVIAVTSKGVF